MILLCLLFGHVQFPLSGYSSWYCERCGRIQQR